jgi:hypothetical protein
MKRAAWKDFTAIAALSVALRLGLGTLGYNCDMVTIFKISGANLGANFYTQFPHAANWGPIPYWIFQFFRRLPDGGNIETFRYYCSALFSGFDLLTGWVLWRMWGLRPAVVFLLASPAAAVISGYHCNAEPAMVALVFLGLYLGERHRLWLHALIGLSLSFKHGFVLLPVWLAMRPGTLRERASGLATSYGIWLAITSPYWLTNAHAVLNNVLLYSGWSGNSLLPFAVKGLLKLTGIRFADLSIEEKTLRPMWLPLFLAAMGGIGWLLRNLPVRSIVICYTLALLSVASAIALQYFALPCAALAVTGGVLASCYNLLCLLLMSAHELEIHVIRIGTWFKDRTLDDPPMQWNHGWLLLQGLLAVILLLRLRDEGLLGLQPRATIRGATSPA